MSNTKVRFPKAYDILQVWGRGSGWEDYATLRSCVDISIAVSKVTNDPMLWRITSGNMPGAGETLNV